MRKLNLIRLFGLGAWLLMALGVVHFGESLGLAVLYLLVGGLLWAAAMLIER